MEGLKHIVHSYDEELEHLDHLIEEMGTLAVKQLEGALQALAKKDAELARQIAAKDKKIDALESEVDALVVRVLALRQPMAMDLRRVIAAMKTAGSLERIGDYARNIANRSQAVTSLAGEESGMRLIERMGGIAGGMIRDALEAYRDVNVELAEEVRRRDEAVDELNTNLFRELLNEMLEAPRDVTPAMHLLFIAKNLERIGDHVTNVAEHVHVMATAEAPEWERPKKDQSSMIMPVASKPS